MSLIPNEGQVQCAFSVRVDVAELAARLSFEQMEALMEGIAKCVSVDAAAHA